MPWLVFQLSNPGVQRVLPTFKLFAKVILFLHSIFFWRAASPASKSKWLLILWAWLLKRVLIAIYIFISIPFIDIDVGLRKIMSVFSVKYFLNELKKSTLTDNILRCYLRILKSILENEAGQRSFFEEDGLSVLVALMDSLIESKLPYHQKFLFAALYRFITWYGFFDNAKSFDDLVSLNHATFGYPHDERVQG